MGAGRGITSSSSFDPGQKQPCIGSGRGENQSLNHRDAKAANPLFGPLLAIGKNFRLADADLPDAAGAQ